MRIGSPLTRSLILAFLLTGSLAAHHSFDSQYDKNKQIELKGTVSKLEWINPHVYVHLDVKDSTGKVTTWKCELGSPNLIVSRGLNKDALAATASITVSGAAAKDGSNTVNAVSIQLANNPQIFHPSSATVPGQ